MHNINEPKLNNHINNWTAPYPVRNMKFVTLLYYPDKDKVNISKSEMYYFGGLILFIIFCLLALINQENWNIDSLKAILNVCLFIFLGLILYGMFISFNSTEKPNGILTGYLSISTDHIEINEDRFEIENVKNLKITIKDYKGKFQSPGLSFSPCKSAGIDNTLKFKYQNKIIEKQFRINSENEFKLLSKLEIELNSLA